MALNVIIVGGGKEGTYLASLLFSRGYGVKVIEVRREEEFPGSSRRSRQARSYWAAARIPACWRMRAYGRPMWWRR